MKLFDFFKRKRTPQDEASDVDSPGWDAIEGALKNIYGSTEPKHYGTFIPWSLGGNDPLRGLSAYARTEPRPHWHIVTYGFTDLYEKEGADPDVSGFGFELTFRVSGVDADEPPVWALNFLQNIARYVFESGNAIGAGDHMNANGPIALGVATDITCIAFAHDPELPSEIDTPNGRLHFLQVVGVTHDEYQAMKRWNTTEVLKLLARENPLLITDLARTSILRDENVVRQIEEGIERNGSSQSQVRGPRVVWESEGGKLRVTLDATVVDDVIMSMFTRLGHGEKFLIVGEPQWISLEPASDVAIEEAEAALIIKLSPAAASDLAASLQPKRGTYGFSAIPDLEIIVLPTEILNDKDEVIDVIG